MKHGPVLKFTLCKKYGEFLRSLGHDPVKLSCAEIIALLNQHGVSVE